jgi:hypothetical protein
MQTERARQRTETHEQANAGKGMSDPSSDSVLVGGRADGDVAVVELRERVDDNEAVGEFDLLRIPTVGKGESLRVRSGAERARDGVIRGDSPEELPGSDHDVAQDIVWHVVELAVGRLASEEL